MQKFDSTVHPVNLGRDYSFDSTISEPVLRNYLSRAMIFCYAFVNDTSQMPH